MYKDMIFHQLMYKNQFQKLSLLEFLFTLDLEPILLLAFFKTPPYKFLLRYILSFFMFSM
jgi:hypothetical protein